MCEQAPFQEMLGTWDKTEGELKDGSHQPPWPLESISVSP